MSNEMFKELAKPFPESEIEWRIGRLSPDKKKARLLAYITARAVMDRLDEVVGPENWTDSYRQIHMEGHDGVECTLALKVNGEWVFKADAAPITKIEEMKGAYSDALKRAAVRWGIGRGLYGLGAPSVPVTGGKWFKDSDIPALPKSYFNPLGGVFARSTGNLDKPVKAKADSKSKKEKK